MDVRLSMLIDVARTGSFTAAARERSYVPSAVSQQIASLERELDTDLVDRTARGVRLTAAGEVLVAHARDLLARENDAWAAVTDATAPDGGRLRIATFASAAPGCFAAIEVLRAGRPRLQPVVTTAEPRRAIEAVTSGESDIAVVFDADERELSSRSDVVLSSLIDEHYLAVLPFDHTLASNTAGIQLSALAKEKWVLGETAESPCTRATTAACRGAGFEPTAAVKTDDYPVAIAAVASRVAVAIVPRLALSAAHPHVVALPILGGDNVVRRLSVLRRAARPSALLDEAVDHLIAAFRREP